jgi:hypothetical protein
MIIVKPDAVCESIEGAYPETYYKQDTIEISDAQLNWIGWNHYNDCWNEYDGWTKGLAQYLRELISLAGEGKRTSILLSDQEIEALANSDETCVTAYMVAKAAAIHAVQYLEGKCDIQWHPNYGGYRFNCLECASETKKELGI